MIHIPNRGKIFWAILAMFLLSACGGVPATYYYLLHTSPPEAQTPATPLPVTIAVETFSADMPYGDDRIVYRDSPYEVNFYHYRRWIASPTQLVTQTVREQLKSSGYFQQVVEWPASGTVNYLLRGRIKALEEWDEKNAWYGRVHIVFSLYNDKGNLLWENEYTHQTPAEAKDPLAVVKAISESVEVVVKEAVGEMKNAISLKHE